MLFLCQLGFQLQFGPPTSCSGPGGPSAPRSRGHTEGPTGIPRALRPRSGAAAYFPPRPQVSPYAWGSGTRGTAGSCLGAQQDPESGVSQPPHPHPHRRAGGASGRGGRRRAWSSSPVREGQAEASPGWDGGRARRSTRGKEEGRGLPSRCGVVRRVTLGAPLRTLAPAPPPARSIH